MSNFISFFLIWVTGETEQDVLQQDVKPRSVRHDSDRKRHLLHNIVM
jgi:hypothetical protein